MYHYNDVLCQALIELQNKYDMKILHYTVNQKLYKNLCCCYTPSRNERDPSCRVRFDQVK